MIHECFVPSRQSISLSDLGDHIHWRIEGLFVSWLMRYPTLHMWAFEKIPLARKWILNWKPPQASHWRFSIPAPLPVLNGFFQIPPVKCPVSTKIKPIYHQPVTCEVNYSQILEGGGSKPLFLKHMTLSHFSKDFEKCPVPSSLPSVVKSLPCFLLGIFNMFWGVHNPKRLYLVPPPPLVLGTRVNILTENPYLFHEQTHITSSCNFHKKILISNIINDKSYWQQGILKIRL